MNTTKYRIYLEENSESQPFSLKELLEKFSAGEINNETYVRPDLAGAQYVPVGDVLIRQKASAQAVAAAAPAGPSRVTVVNFDMPFGAMVTFMVKWALASIPAFVILLGLFFVLTFVLMALGVGAVRH